MLGYNNLKIKKNMEGVKISCLRMEPATNGVLICYDKKIENKNKKGTYDNCSYEYPKEVFEMNEGETYDQMLDRAMDRWKELWKQSYNK